MRTFCVKLTVIALKCNDRCEQQQKIPKTRQSRDSNGVVSSSGAARLRRKFCPDGLNVGAFPDERTSSTAAPGRPLRPGQSPPRQTDSLDCFARLAPAARPAPPRQTDFLDRCCGPAGPCGPDPTSLIHPFIHPLPPLGDPSPALSGRSQSLSCLRQDPPPLG
jgi:hypothetical protein